LLVFFVPAQKSGILSGIKQSCDGAFIQTEHFRELAVRKYLVLKRKTFKDLRSPQN
jgi:hypothetical protein